MHSSVVHLLPASANASPKAFVAAESPVPSGCPIAGVSGTLPPLGSIATNSNEASVVGVRSVAPASVERKRSMFGVLTFMLGRYVGTCRGEVKLLSVGVASRWSVVE